MSELEKMADIQRICMALLFVGFICYLFSDFIKERKRIAKKRRENEIENLKLLPKQPGKFYECLVCGGSYLAEAFFFCGTRKYEICGNCWWRESLGVSKEEDKKWKKIEQRKRLK